MLAIALPISKFIAIVLELTNGVLSVSKSSLNQEMLIINFADSFEELDIPPTGGFWFHWNAMDTAFQRRAEWMDREALIGTGAV
jgi:hypothetical protein